MATRFPETPTHTVSRERELAPRLAAHLTRRASLNVIASLLDYFAKMAVGLVITPVLVAGLGPALYGLWEILSRLIGYMSATDGRPTEALRLIISNEQEINDSASKRRLVGSALGVWALFMPLILSAGAVIVWITPAIGKIAVEYYPTVRLTAALLVINFLLVNLVALPESVLRGMNIGYKRMGLQAGLSVMGGLLTAGAIYIGAGVMGVAGAQVLLTGLTGVLFWYVVKKYVPWFGLARPTGGDIRRLLGLSVWNTAGTVIAKLQLASDVLILGVITSASVVTTYVLTGYAAQAVTGIITLAIGAVTPGLAGLIGGKQFEKTAVLRNEILAMNWLLVTAVGSTILLWNRSFLYLWVGEQYYAGLWPNLLIILVMMQTSFIRSDAYLIDATLRLRARVLVNAVAAVLSIAASILLTPSLGIVGLCIGILVGRLAQTIAYPLMIHSYLKCRSFSAKAITRPLLVTGMLFLSSSYLGQQLLAGSWFQWSASVVASLMVITLLALVAGLSVETRTILRKRFRLIVASSLSIDS